MKSRKIRWVEHVARMGDRRDAYNVLMGKPRGQDHLEDLGIDGRIILKSILKMWAVGGGGMECTDVVQDGYRWLVPVNVVMNFWVR
jgi:hypothetical protein